MPTNMSESRKVRVALAVFDDVEDLLRTLDRLGAAGVALADIWVGASAGVEDRLRAGAGRGLPICRLDDNEPGTPAPRLVHGYDSALQRWASVHLKSFPGAGLGTGSAVLIVRISRSIRQLSVSDLLLSTSARVVQLHDMAPGGATNPSSPAIQPARNEE